MYMLMMITITIIYCSMVTSRMNKGNRARNAESTSRKFFFSMDIDHPLGAHVQRGQGVSKTSPQMFWVHPTESEAPDEVQHPGKPGCTGSRRSSIFLAKTGRRNTPGPLMVSARPSLLLVSICPCIGQYTYTYEGPPVHTSSPAQQTSANEPFMSKIPYPDLPRQVLNSLSLSHLLV